MPIWLRKFTFNKLQEHYQPKDNEDIVQKSKQAMKSAQADGVIPKVNVPTYVTKASRASSKK